MGSPHSSELLEACPPARNRRKDKTARGRQEITTGRSSPAGSGGRGWAGRHGRAALTGLPGRPGGFLSPPASRPKSGPSPGEVAGPAPGAPVCTGSPARPATSQARSSGQGQAGKLGSPRRYGERARGWGEVTESRRRRTESQRHGGDSVRWQGSGLRVPLQARFSPLTGDRAVSH